MHRGISSVWTNSLGLQRMKSTDLEIFTRWTVELKKIFRKLLLLCAAVLEEKRDLSDNYGLATHRYVG